MDVLLVHYQPSSAGLVQPSVVATLGGLAYTHPHGTVPFLKVALYSLAQSRKLPHGSDSLLTLAVSSKYH